MQVLQAQISDPPPFQLLTCTWTHWLISNVVNQIKPFIKPWTTTKKKSLAAAAARKEKELVTVLVSVLKDRL